MNFLNALHKVNSSYRVISVKRPSEQFPMLTFLNLALVTIIGVCSNREEILHSLCIALKFTDVIKLQILLLLTIRQFFGHFITVITTHLHFITQSSFIFVSLESFRNIHAACSVYLSAVCRADVHNIEQQDTENKPEHVFIYRRITQTSAYVHTCTL